MRHHDHFHCPICGAKFDKKDELDVHDKRLHTPQGVSGVAPRNEYLPREGEPSSRKADEEAPRPRKNKTFTRGHME